LRATPRIVFAGTPEFSVPALDALHGAGFPIAAVYTQPDRPAGRGRELSASPVKRRALELSLPVEQPANLKLPEAQQKLASFAPEVMVVVAYGLILPQAVLDVPRHGCLNIHATLLPRWRGAAPIQRAVLAGDLRTGITIMLMDAGLDTGPGLLRRETAIDPRETAGELHDRLAAIGASAIVEAVELWTEGRVQPRPQPADGVTYAAKLRKDEARVDWSQAAIEIDARVRAFNPWPVAETRLGDEQVRIWRAQPVEAPSGSDAPPGTVIDAPSGRLYVSTGDGALEILVLQFPGRKPLPAGEVLKSRNLRAARFDLASR
jgi:methionyl-tRNA formyltransferase